MTHVFLSRTRKRRRVAFFTNNNTLFFVCVVSIRIVFLINKLESLFFTNERVLKRLLLNVYVRCLKLSVKKMMMHHVVTPHTPRISLFFSLSKKKKFSLFSLSPEKDRRELFAFFPHADRERKKDLLFCCVSVVKRLKVHFFLSLCQNE